jgi:hypothetical protein
MGIGFFYIPPLRAPPVPGSLSLPVSTQRQITPVKSTFCEIKLLIYQTDTRIAVIWIGLTEALSHWLAF